MAVIQTPKGRVIGLIVEEKQPVSEPKAVETAAEEKSVFQEEPPKRGRPRKQ